MDCRRMMHHVSGAVAVLLWGLAGLACQAHKDMRAAPSGATAPDHDPPAERAGAESSPPTPRPEVPPVGADGGSDVRAVPPVLVELVPQNGVAQAPLEGSDGGAGAGRPFTGTGALGAREGEDEIPSFPWPPPRASTQVVLPREALVAGDDATPTLKSVEVRLRRGLDDAGYVDTSYYAVPGGFALVTRLEQIEEDGRPKPAPERWMVDLRPLRKFSLGAYLKSLFTAQPGYYRILVFVFTDKPFTTARDVITRDEANDWLASGANRLPTALGERSFSLSHACTVLVYEFEQPDRGQEAIIRSPGRLAARTHLVRANVWGKLLP